MSEEFRSRIFEPYSREETESTREVQGTGLGMVIVQNIVNKMHGTIEVNSRLGEGTEFIIVVPFTPAASPSAPTLCSAIFESSGRMESISSFGM